MIDNGLFRSNDGARSWSQIGQQELQTETFQCMAATPTLNDGGRLFAGSETSGLWYSENGGKSLIASPQGKIIAQDPSTHEEGIVSAEIPIAEFRKNRTIPNYALEMVQEIFSQYQQEIPINHLDMPIDQLPQTGEEMKELFDELSRYLNKPEMSEPVSRN